jgi:hypothetical protein
MPAAPSPLASLLMGCDMNIALSKITKLIHFHPSALLTFRQQPNVNMALEKVKNCKITLPKTILESHTSTLMMV